ncbi:hypothetical protein TRFO_22975 [Tritrichomonas foetus]|uniref:Uncharacterized protein n=1 Tax=Tritrichomonas foetus TaxID=1144522 RepID=A0A1J4KC22_9EUKA|nr:hypothetical protein TRFO_22975 [Tritrichomonas foetus]|eukprot:OHT08472.1 hypothetical protein TRFO_22975 [Tritrichomonas foetus]
MKWQSKSSIIKYLAMLPVYLLMSHPYYSPSLLTSILTSQPIPVQAFSSHSNLFSFFPKSLTTTSSISTFRLSPEMLVNLLHNNQNSTSRQVQYKILNKAMQLNVIDRSGKENEFRVEMPFPMSPQKRHQIDSWNIRGEWNDYGNEVFITWNIVNENCNRKKIPINDFDLLFDFGMLKQTIRVFISKIEAMTPFLNKRKNIFNKEHTIRIKMIRFPSDSQFIAKFEGKIKSNFMDFILLKGNLFPLSKLEKYCEITTVSKMNQICMQYNVSITHFHVIEEENTNDYNKIVVLTLRISEPFVSSISNDSSESPEELRSMAIFWVRNPLYITARLD